MTNRPVVYPFLFILFLILHPLIQNIEQVDPAQAARPLAVLLVLAAAGMVAAYALTRDWAYSGYLAFLGLAFFFLSGDIHRLLLDWLPRRSEPPPLVLTASLGLLLALLGLRPIWERFLSGWVTRMLNVSLSIAVLLQLIPALDDLAQQGWFQRALANQTARPLSLDCSNSPDIYTIILDGHGRADVLDELYGVDSRPFIDFLERRGFYVASRSATTYIQTALSVPSLLNFDYLAPQPEGVSGRGYFEALFEENAVMRLLEQCGYTRVAFDSGFSFTDEPPVDVYLTEGSQLNDFENLLLLDSPLEPLLKQLKIAAPEYSYEAHRRRVLYTLHELSRLPQMAGPKFVFAHILSPHPPFVFDAGGSPLTPPGGYSLADGDDFGGDWDEYRQGYAGQALYIDRMLQDVIDDILAGSPQPPIIILQGDHGPGGLLSWDSPGESCLWERTSILNAYHLPGRGAEALYPEISPVNTFRVIFNAYFGANLELLPDKTFYSSQRLERLVMDVTAERGSKEGCAVP